MRQTRWLIPMMVLLLLCAQGDPAHAEHEGGKSASDRLVIDPKQSSLLRQSFYLEDLNAVLAPVLTPELLSWTGKYDAGMKKSCPLFWRPRPGR